MQHRGRSLFAAVLPLLSGCSLLLDFDDPPDAPDAAVPDAIASEACSFGEPNDLRTMAAALAPGTGTLAAICEDGDHDFYSVTVGDAQTLSFEILFAQDGARGDLDLKLTDVNGNELAKSVSTDADEKIVCPGDAPPCVQLAAGSYFVEVYGFSATTTNAYTINYALTP